ncbi:signal peptidase II [Corynebacterium sp. H113]|uniref:signal peptidase II n=1 Tax=Corynebacterium sp. H113 TaxID=3133419 RepID=UPI0030A00E93
MTKPADTTQNARLKPLIGLLIATIVVVAVIDQISKIVAVGQLEGKPPIDVIGDWFQLTLLRNPGAAFSMGAESTWIFTSIQIVFIVLVGVFSKYLVTRTGAIAAGMVAGGALGNLIDRLFRDPSFYVGHVVDFFSVKHFAVFNVADAAITVGVIVLATWIVFSKDLDTAFEKEAEDADDAEAANA